MIGLDMLRQSSRDEDLETIMVQSGNVSVKVHDGPQTRGCCRKTPKRKENLVHQNEINTKYMY